MTLDDSQLLELRNLIVALIAENDQTALQVSAAAKTVELDQNRVGRLSRMDAMQGQALAQAGRSRRTELASDLRAALQRLETGRYGFCDECGEDIAYGRLKADPTAKYCIACAQSRERK